MVWTLVIFDWLVLSMRMRMQVILDSPFARPGSAPVWGGKKGEFRDWTILRCAWTWILCFLTDLNTASTTFNDITATTAFFRSTASTPHTQSPCIRSLDCYDITSNTAVRPPTDTISSVAPSAESPCSGPLTCHGTCV